ncbi:MAG: type IV toxin-antitoxin system AbiEi family antitoxin [Protaetiibacter sp.]
MTLFPLLGGLSDVELQAAELDGECYRLGDGFLPIGMAPTVESRAAAAIGARPTRLVAALGTAAWVWGAADRFPARGEYLVALDARWRPPATEHAHIVESVLRPGDVVRFGGATVTSPLRTAIDLARFRAEFGSVERTAVHALAHVGGFDLADALAAMDRGRNLSGKRTAAARLRAALSPS